MLVETAAGTCPVDIMAGKLLTACNEQLPKMRPELSALGPITSMTFVEAETVNGHRIETYKVAFTKGGAQTWHIGDLENGRFQAAWSNED